MSKPSLPESYIHHIREMLGSEAEAFIDSYNQPRVQGLRFNSLKATPELKNR